MFLLLLLLLFVFYLCISFYTPSFAIYNSKPQSEHFQWCPLGLVSSVSPTHGLNEGEMYVTGCRASIVHAVTHRPVVVTWENERLFHFVYSVLMSLLSNCLRQDIFRFYSGTLC